MEMFRHFSMHYPEVQRVLYLAAGVDFAPYQLGYIVSAEVNQLDTDGYVYRQRIPWHEWID